MTSEKERERKREKRENEKLTNHTRILSFIRVTPVIEIVIKAGNLMALQCNRTINFFPVSMALG